jgi:hypothetical protein
LVTAIGEESFVDRNGNGIMDQDEQFLFENLPEAFIDQNEDGAYTPALPACQASPSGSAQCIAGTEEIFVDFNDNQVYDLNDDPPLYNGLLCPPDGDGIWCSRELVNVRDQSIVILGDTEYDIILVRNGRIVQSTIHGELQIAYISDYFNNRPPAGSTVTVVAQGDCQLLSEGSYTVGNSAAYGAYSVGVVTGPPDEPSDPPVPGTVKVTLAPIAGPTASRTYACDSSGSVDPCDGASPLPPECSSI